MHRAPPRLQCFAELYAIGIVPGFFSNVFMFFFHLSVRLVWDPVDKLRRFMMYAILYKHHDTI